MEALRGFGGIEMGGGWLLIWNPYGVRGEGDGWRAAIEMEPLRGSGRGRWVEGGY